MRRHPKIYERINNHYYSKTRNWIWPLNKRGILKLSVLISILLRLIYNWKYEIIKSNKSDSNIGARKSKSWRNHIWIINGINHEVNSSKRHAQLVIQSFDFSQMFDSMSLKPQSLIYLIMTCNMTCLFCWMKWTKAFQCQ